MPFRKRASIPAAGDGVPDYRHDELAPASLQRPFNPSPFPLIDRAQDTGIDGEQREILGLHFKKRRSLRSNVDAIQPAQTRGLRHKLVDPPSIGAGKARDRLRRAPL